MPHAGLPTRVNGRHGRLARFLAPRWRRVLSASWLLFAVSFLLPALSYSCDAPDAPAPPPPPADSTATEASATSAEPRETSPAPPSWDDSQVFEDLVTGYHAFLLAVGGAAGPLGVISALTTLLILGSAMHGRWSSDARWPVLVLAAATVLNAWFWPSWAASDGDKTLQFGYLAWVASFACATVAFWMRARE